MTQPPPPPPRIPPLATRRSLFSFLFSPAQHGETALFNSQQRSSSLRRSRWCASSKQRGSLDAYASQSRQTVSLSFLWWLWFVYPTRCALVCACATRASLPSVVWGGSGATTREHENLGRNGERRLFRSLSKFSPSSTVILPPVFQSCVIKRSYKHDTGKSQR